MGAGFPLDVEAAAPSASWEIARHRTAKIRTGPSRPVTLALRHGLLTGKDSLFDYGCGRGGDIRYLQAMGYTASGWDPVHAAEASIVAADIVNLGFVLNVIEDPEERVATLREAWRLTQEALVLAVRPEWEMRQVEGHRWRDGVVTVKGTFQKFYSQEELRDLVKSVTDTPPVAIAPGIFFVFRDASRSDDLRARLVRRATVLPRQTGSEARYERHRDILQPLMAFVEQRGRLPLDDEVSTVTEVKRLFGSLPRAFSLLRRVQGEERWSAVRRAAQESLIVFLALAAFRRRPRFSDLSDSLRADVKALFGNYARACTRADEALFSLGDSGQLDYHLRASTIGKVLPDALYVHAGAVSDLDVVLRLYEGCASVLLGEVDGANVVKLSRQERRVSYLTYPLFDTDPHPALASSIRVDLQSFEIRRRDYTNSDNPPVLHRKDCLVSHSHPAYVKFRRLSESEERRGLLDSGRPIGTRREWEELLEEKRVRLHGHRLVHHRAP
jgi:DNA phosphorothioation-associated putative methyltransferase